MLLVNAAVTVLPQAATGVLGWRGKNLVRGLVTILNQLDPKITEFCAQQIALGVVRHLLIARDEGKVETVIQREELTRILLAFGGRPQARVANRSTSTRARR